MTPTIIQFILLAAFVTNLYTPNAYSIQPEGAPDVEFITFSAHRQKGKALIDWATSAEREVSHYSLEKSYNGIDFFVMKDYINGSGISSDIQTYGYTDENSAQEIEYCRLRVTTYNGNVSYSNIITAGKTCTDEKQLKIYPNPAIAGSDIDFSLLNHEFSEKTSIRIIDLRGQVILEQTGNIQHFSKNLSELSIGTYCIVVSDSQKSYRERLLIK